MTNFIKRTLSGIGFAAVMLAAFLEGRVKYTDIPRGIEKMMDFFPARTLGDVAAILEFDREVREKTLEFIP